MFSSASRIAGLLAATYLALAALAPAANAQTRSQGRPDATHVPMVVIGETYCRSIDNEDKSSFDFYTSAADVTAKSGKVIQSHNGGNCCTAAFPWNGSACAAPLICAAGTEPVNGTCVATVASCAAIGMTLINGACGVAAPPSANASQYIGRIIRMQVSMAASDIMTNEHIEFYVDGKTTNFGVRLAYYWNESSNNWYESYKLLIVDNISGSTKSGAIANATSPTIKNFFQKNYGNDVRFVLGSSGLTITGTKRTNLLSWSWTDVDGKKTIPF